MRRTVQGLAFALLCVISRPAAAEVLSRSAGGFQLRHVVQSTQAPLQAYTRFVAVGQWWSDAHTYGGKASALTIDARAGGCWCEQMPNGGSVRHLSVAVVMPGTLLRFDGGLGPLGAMGVSGAMTVTFTAKGNGTEVVVTYNVAGYAPDGLAGLAPIVDGVIAEQLARYVAMR